MGLYNVSSIGAASLFADIKDTMLRCNLPMSKLRGQCYDGCSTMSGLRSGVEKRVQDVESREVFTHCYSHFLNLAASDSIKNSKLMKLALETTYEITKLIKLSPPREAVFKALQAESESISSSIKLLCPTRWTVRAKSLSSIVDNYSVLLNTWDEVSEMARDTEIKARIQGVASQMNTFNFLFGTLLGESVLRHTALQNKSRSATEWQMIADMVVRTLSTLRSDSSFDLF